MCDPYNYDAGFMIGGGMSPEEFALIDYDRMIESQPVAPTPLTNKLHYLTNAVAELWDLAEVDPERAERIVDRVTDALSEI